ncbi:GNAT family N-acetyltransferase [Amnibacterium kyonggiense]
MTGTVRFAGPADAAALVELRAAMFGAMAQDASGAGWRAGALRWFEEALAGDDVLVAVVDAAGLGPVACAMAVVERRAPSPTNPLGLAAHLSQVSTLAGHRRRGHARACLTALLARLDDRGVGRTDLFATAEGEALYRALGFRSAPHPALRRP